MSIHLQEARNGERVLVCLSPALGNAKVIRAAARMADSMQGTFTALYVETPETAELPEKSRQALMGNVRLAEQLGARIATGYGEDVPTQIAEYAQASRITKIVMGRSVQTRLMTPSLVDRLMACAPDLDVYIIPDIQSPPPPAKNVFRSTRLFKMKPVNILISLFLLAGCTILGQALVFVGFREANVMTIYMLGILFNSLFATGWICGLMFSVFSVFLYNYFFTVPRLSFDYHGEGGVIIFVVMFVAAMIIGILTERLQSGSRQATLRAHRTEVLLDAGHRVRWAESTEEILQETAWQLIKLLDRPVVVYRVHDKELLAPELYAHKKEENLDYLSEDERAVAQWVQQNNRRAGATTKILSDAKCMYLPVRGGEVFAVIGIAASNVLPLDLFEKNLMIAMLGESGFALEKERLNEARKQAEIRMEQEQFRANLLRMIAHDLRTPLTNIAGSAEILLNNAGRLSKEQKNERYLNIYDDAVWLNDLVENLLSIARIEDQRIHLDLQPEFVAEAFEGALRRVTRESACHHITHTIEDDLLMARMDSRLIVHVIINLVNNAVNYTPPGSHIHISARREDGLVLVEVADNGPGIRDQAKEKIFDLFYIADNERGDNRRGLGLGLYLCKAIVEAHGGSLTVKDNDPKGVVFGFTLQAEEAMILE